MKKVVFSVTFHSWRHGQDYVLLDRFRNERWRTVHEPRQIHEDLRA